MFIILDKEILKSVTVTRFRGGQREIRLKTMHVSHGNDVILGHNLVRQVRRSLTVSLRTGWLPVRSSKPINGHINERIGS